MAALRCVQGGANGMEALPPVCVRALGACVRVLSALVGWFGLGFGGKIGGHGYWAS